MLHEIPQDKKMRQTLKATESERGLSFIFRSEICGGVRPLEINCTDRKSGFSALVFTSLSAYNQETSHFLQKLITSSWKIKSILRASF